MSGIIEKQQPHNFLLRFNLKNAAIISFNILGGFAPAKLLDEAVTYDEYMEIASKVNFAINFTVCYINIVWKTPELFGLVKNLEDNINQSK